MRVEKNPKHLHIEFMVTSHNSGETISFFRFKVIMANDKHLTQMNCVKYAKYEL